MEYIKRDGNMRKQTVMEDKQVTFADTPVPAGTRPVDIRIGYIGGGSRGWAHALMNDLACCPYFKGEVRLYDIDYDAASFNAAFGNWVNGLPGNKSQWRYRAVRTLKEALTGADFVFLSIQPGPIEWMKHDLELPMRYGIYQPVGDTVGPGGIVRGLRTARIYRGFAEAVMEYAPRAWVLNMTNPMTVCTRTLHAAAPGIRAHGCCHEVFSTQYLLGRLFAKKMRCAEPPRTEVQVNVLGINHFTWIDRAECRGIDLMKLVRARIAEPSAMRFYTKRELLKDPENYFESRNHVAFELLRRFGVLAAAGDRHLAEFVPWFLTGPESCYRWGFILTPYSFRINRWRKSPALFRRQMTGKAPFAIKGSDEDFMKQMAALVGLARCRTNVNLPNRGQMDGIPAGAVVETNAVFSRDGIVPIASGALPPAVNALVYQHVVNQEAVVAAALVGDEDLGFRAFFNDPLVRRLTIDQAARLFKAMLKATHFRF